MKKKLKILSIVLAVFALMLCVDFIISKLYSYEIVSVTPERGIADGNTTVTLVVRLMRGGKAVEGHNIYIITDRSRIGRRTTDADGLITVTYTCYYAASANSVADVDIKFYDEDNSLLIYVPAQFMYTLPMDSPGSGGTGTPVDTIFFD